MIALLLLAQAVMAMPAATGPQPVCVRAEIVPGFEGWAAGGDAALAIGKPAALTLPPIADASFAPPLERPGGAGTFGNGFPFVVREAGDYRVALSAGAWIDVVKDGTRLASTAHMHGPACSGIAKIVTFTLQPGSYVLQISGIKAPAIRVMIVKG